MAKKKTDSKKNKIEKTKTNHPIINDEDFEEGVLEEPTSLEDDIVEEPTSLKEEIVEEPTPVSDEEDFDQETVEDMPFGTVQFDEEFEGEIISGPGVTDKEPELPQKPKKRKNTFLFIVITVMVIAFILGAILTRSDSFTDPDETENVATNVAKINATTIAPTTVAIETTTAQETTTEESTTTEVMFARVTADTLYVHSAPKEKSDVIGYVDQDEDFEIIDRKGKWIEIDCGSTQGFVLKKFIKEITANEADNTGNELQTDI
ncbi:MAG: SH3 domain-containing protein [Eubacterium sp.]|nr:SH3 domain-containing protein [Eubacterium sp.]